MNIWCLLQEGKPEIVASKFGDRSSYACIAATHNNEFSIGLPAKQGIARNGTLTVVNNFQFLSTELTSEQITEAISKSCLCKVNRNKSNIEYELSKGDEIYTKISPFDVAVHLLKNTYGMCSFFSFIRSQNKLPINGIHLQKMQLMQLLKQNQF